MMISAKLNSPRSWTLLASLATRGTGFLTSLLIARLAGAYALGTYSALANTSAAVATPFALILTNNATVMGAQGCKDKPGHSRMQARASYVLALLLSALSTLALYLLYEFMLDGGSERSPILLITGSFVIVGQMVGAISLGFLYGAGEFKLVSRITVLVALATCLIAYPTIQQYGLHGALVLLLFISLSPPILLGVRVLARNHNVDEPGFPYSQARREVRSRFIRALPSVATISANNGIYWICSIHLVQSTFGTAGVGLIAVATQWLNLMLIPATSWGSVSLKALADAIKSGDEHTARHAANVLMLKNLLVTIPLAGAIALASTLIARAYGLNNTVISLLICLNAACASVAAINNVFERFLFALDRQVWWLCFSLISLAAQLTVTVMFIENGLWVVAVGVFLAGLILCLLSYVGVSKALPMKMKEQK